MIVSYVEHDATGKLVHEAQVFLADDPAAPDLDTTRDELAALPGVTVLPGEP